MPTYDALPRFRREYRPLTSSQRATFGAAVRRFVNDLKAQSLRSGLRVRLMSGHPGVYELTWADDGRATVMFGDPILAGHAHIIWRRIGTHDIFDES